MIPNNFLIQFDEINSGNTIFALLFNFTTKVRNKRELSDFV